MCALNIRKYIVLLLKIYGQDVFSNLNEGWALTVEVSYKLGLELIELFKDRIFSARTVYFRPNTVYSSPGPYTGKNR